MPPLVKHQHPPHPPWLVHTETWHPMDETTDPQYVLMSRQRDVVHYVDQDLK